METVPAQHLYAFQNTARLNRQKETYILEYLMLTGGAYPGSKVQKK